MVFCDLHTHSNFSDGSFTPEEIISEAKKLSLTVALTDHNTVEGLEAFLKEAQRQGVTAIGGTELTTDCNGAELHLLGLFIDPVFYDDVENLVKKFRKLKEKSNTDMLERFNAAGFALDYESIKKRSKNGNVNRVQFAHELVEKGYAETVNEAFEKYLDEKKEYYVPSEHLKLIDAIRFLRKIRAVPVLAHPLQELDEASLREILPEAIEAGLLGMETYHSSYDNEKIALAVKIAAEFGLYQSGGSDFHGEGKRDIKLAEGKGNLAIPLLVYEKLKSLKETL